MQDALNTTDAERGFVAMTAKRVADDLRADGGERWISLEPGRVLIERRFAGIEMRVGVPAKAYLGVALSIDALPNGQRTHRLYLAHQDRELDVNLPSSSGDAVADWKHWARFFCAPRLGERFDGELEAVAETSLPLMSAPRRRGAILTRRRPRFSMRRKLGASGHEQARPESIAEIGTYE